MHYENPNYITSLLSLELLLLLTTQFTLFTKKNLIIFKKTCFCVVEEKCKWKIIQWFFFTGYV